MRRGVVATILAVVAITGCQRGDRGAADRSPGAQPAALAGAGGALAVPRVTGAIKLDGEADEPDWTAAARSGPFMDAAGGEARPFSEARFLRDEHNLYVMLYAADDDIRARVKDHDGPVWIDDAFSLRLTPAGDGAPTYLVDVSATGVTMDARRGRDGRQDASWESGTVAAVDRDGTLDDPSDEDEEWVVEAAIPLGALGVTGAPGARIQIEVSRCDTPRTMKERRCGAFGGPKDRRTLELL